MAAVVGDLATDHSRFHAHNVIASSGLHHDHSPRLSCDSAYRRHSVPRAREFPAQNSRPPTSPPNYWSSDSTTTTLKRTSETERESSIAVHDQHSAVVSSVLSASGGASRFPSPPDSSSPVPSPTGQKTKNGKTNSSLMATQTRTTAPVAAAISSTPAAARQPPSPASVASASAGEAPPVMPHDATALESGHTIVVHDLEHVQRLARTDLINGASIHEDKLAKVTRYEISGMPINDIIEMVAALLTKITTTNDMQHDALHRNAAHQQTAASHNNDGASMSPLSSSVLAFHGKNVPAITILSYLSRIHKYCPTTYEVFLSLLVYFDRMTERVNNMVMKDAHKHMSTISTDTDMFDGADGINFDRIDNDVKHREGAENMQASTTSSPATYFVVDSFNIHRLVIAGVTCASKFFSDVFYTNSRYAKVGGLPLAELNHLELQFLLLNDFRLAVPVEDLEAYATMLVEFYAREVVIPETRD